MADTNLRDPKIEAAILKDMLATDEGFKKLNYDRTMLQAEKFQKCYREGCDIWLYFNAVLSGIRSAKQYMTKSHFHEEMSRLLTDGCAINAATNIRTGWAKGNPEIAKMPFPPDQHARQLLRNKDYKNPIDIRSLSGQCSKEIFKKIKHHNYLANANVSKISFICNFEQFKALRPSGLLLRYLRFL